jgi:hypothetical protein
VTSVDPHREEEVVKQAVSSAKYFEVHAAQLFTCSPVRNLLLLDLQGRKESNGHGFHGTGYV